MTTNFEEFNLTRTEFAVLAGSTVTRLFSNDETFLKAAQAVRLILNEIEEATGMDGTEWLRSPLSDEVPLTPLRVWKYKPSLGLLLSNPVEAMDSCFPDWRVLCVNGEMTLEDIMKQHK